MSKHAMTDPDARAKANRKEKKQAAKKNPLAPATAAGVISDPTTDPAGSMPANQAAGTEPAPATNQAAGMEPGPMTNQAAGQPAAATPASPARSMKMADLKLVRSKADRKSKRLVVYNIEGRTGSVQFLSTLFGGSQTDVGNPPETLTLSGEFAEPKAAKPKETAEERKARLAALPKPTLAEKVAKAEERAAKLREKLAKAATAGQPAGEAVPA